MGLPTLATCARTCFNTATRRLSTTRRHVQFSGVFQFKMAFSTIQRGSPNASNFKLFFRNEAGLPISPFHDIPLVADAEKNTFNMVVEIPRWSNAKMEISKEQKLNPIVQDVKKDKLRYVKNIFPHHGYIWNYGALPQTYEDPSHITPEIGTKGDSDPLDVCEIGFKIHERGAVVPVKVLGVMCLIDEGETDWKVLVIDATDPLADKISDVSDIEANYPGLLRATYEWFKYYKVPDGKPENQFAFEGQAKDKNEALKVIEETHKQWKDLILKEDESAIARENSTVEESPFRIEATNAASIVESTDPPGPPAEISQDVNRWYYVIPQQ